MIDQFRIDSFDGVDWRIFSHTFAELLETLPLEIRGADSTLTGLEIEVVPSPMLTDIQLTQKFPAYLDRPDRTVMPGSRVTVPDGTSVTVDAAANKDLTEAVVVVDGIHNPLSLSLHAGEATENDRFEASRSFQYSLENLRKDTRLEFQLRDTDSLRNRQPIRLDFTILKDKPPTVTARLDGIGAAITSNAVLPAAGELTDDYGIASAAFRYTAEKAAPAEGEQTESASETSVEGMTAIDGIGATQTLFTLNVPFSVADCSVEPGDKLSLWIEATDRFDLDETAGQIEEGQTGAGQRWTLEIVTPERLRGLLEVREITLRQRFEVLIGEVELTKELIETIMLDVPADLAEEAANLTLQEIENETEAEKTKRQETLDGKRKALLETISKEQGDAGRYSISRALRDTRKEVYEIRTIIESFRQIRAEMVNNRIFTGDDETRLDGGIVFPMHGLVETDFPELDRLIGLLDDTLAVRGQPLRSIAVAQRQEVLTQLDELLKKMSAIRDGMISMESFNEVVDMLRAIIRQQQQLRRQTVEEKNKRLKELLE